MADNINKLQIPTCDTESFDIAFEFIPEQSLLYNEETQTLYQKSNGEAIAIGSLVSYTKGINALHYEGEIEEAITEYPEDESYTNGTVLHIKEESLLYEGTDDEVTLYEDSFIVNIGDIENPSWHQIGKGGGAAGDDIECKALTVTSKNTGDKGKWVTNLYLGNTSTRGRYLLFNDYDPKAQTYAAGHFLFKGAANVYHWHVVVGVVGGTTSNMVTLGEAPASLYSCSCDGKQYYSVNISGGENFDVYYTGWISSNFKVFSYTSSDLSNFSRIALGELDLDNLPVLEGVPAPKFAGADGGQTITNYVGHWDFDENPICYLRITGGNDTSRNFNSICSRDYIWENSQAIQAITGNAEKPVYLILDKCTNYNFCTNTTGGIKNIGTVSTPYGNFTGDQFQTQWKFCGNTNTPYEGLVGLVLPQDANSNVGPANWSFLFCSNLPNLTSLKLNQYSTGINSNNLMGLEALTSITFPDALDTFNTDGESAPLMDSIKLQAIYFPNKTDAVSMNGYTTLCSQLYWIDGFNFYVPASMLSTYKEKYASIGYLSGLFKSY